MFLTLCLMCSYVTLCGSFRAKAQGSQRLSVVFRRGAEAQRLGVFCVFSVCFETALSQRLGVKYVSYASPYVFLCDLIWFISRKDAKLAKAGCGFSQRRGGAEVRSFLYFSVF